jgi:hypothetical protein
VEALSDVLGDGAETGDSVEVGDQFAFQSLRFAGCSTATPARA